MTPSRIIIGKMNPQNSCPECDREVFEEKERKEKEYERKEKISRFRINCGVPVRYADKRLSDITANQATEKAIKWLSRYLEVLDERLKLGASGSICGDMGTGKTLMGCAMVNEIIDREYCSRYVSAWEMIQTIRAAYRMTDTSTLEQISSFKNYDFLVIDEIGVQAGTPDERILMNQVIDGRYNMMKSTVLISNSMNPVKDGYLDARVLDRLMENGGFNLALNGDSFRRGCGK